MPDLDDFLEDEKADLYDKDEIADMLKVSREALDAFEKKYKAEILLEKPKDFFAVNSRQMADHKMASYNMASHKTSETKLAAQQKSIKDRIVNEMLSEVSLYKYRREEKTVEFNPARGLPSKEECVQLSDLSIFSENAPQFSGLLQKRDFDVDNGRMLMGMLRDSMDTTKTEEYRRQMYHLFRQGLDIQDIDPLLYEILGCNKNSMGYWFPKITDAVDNEGFFKIPDTTIMKVPMNMLQLTRCDYMELTRTTLDIVDEVCYKAFGLEEEKDYFIKTGTYSSKFDFRNAKVTSAKEVRELGEYLLFIHHQANQMASPMNIGENGRATSIYGVSTTNEWVVREFIPDKEHCPTIYKGLPLHTEYRVFVDFDADEVLGVMPYWEPETMKKRFGEKANRDIHSLHDYAIYKEHENALMEQYNVHKDEVILHLENLIADIDLPGQWSVDIMKNGDDFWLIDMALAENSAFYKDAVPPSKRHPLPEDWIPRICVR